MWKKCQVTKKYKKIIKDNKLLQKLFKWTGKCLKICRKQLKNIIESKNKPNKPKTIEDSTKTL